MKDLLQTEYSAHDARADVDVLSLLLKKLQVSREAMQAVSFSATALHHDMKYKEEKKKNIKSLEPLVGAGVMKMCTAEKVAGSGLCLAHLKLLFRRGGEDALRDNFIHPNKEGKPRVTKDKKTLNEVIPKLGQYLDKLE